MLACRVLSKQGFAIDLVDLQFANPEAEIFTREDGVHIFSPQPPVTLGWSTDECTWHQVHPNFADASSSASGSSSVQWFEFRGGAAQPHHSSRSSARTPPGSGILGGQKLMDSKGYMAAPVDARAFRTHLVTFDECE